MFATDFTL